MMGFSSDGKSLTGKPVEQGRECKSSRRCIVLAICVSSDSESLAEVEEDEAVEPCLGFDFVSRISSIPGSRSTSLYNSLIGRRRGLRSIAVSSVRIGRNN